VMSLRNLEGLRNRCRLVELGAAGSQPLSEGLVAAVAPASGK
jgi:hypothetical protein